MAARPPSTLIAATDMAAKLALVPVQYDLHSFQYSFAVNVRWISYGLYVQIYSERKEMAPVSWNIWTP